MLFLTYKFLLVKICTVINNKSILNLMKTNFFSVTFILFLLIALIKCFSNSLPFIKGKYVYWLLFLSIITLVLIINNKSKRIRINIYDSIILLLAILGITNFILLSKSTLYDLSIWYYTGYFIVYLLLRTLSNPEPSSKKALNLLLYFCSVTAVLNVFVMLLQLYHFIPSANKFFLTTGMFYSPNQLAIYFSIGCLTSLFLLRKTTTLGLKISLTVSILLIIIGICITESRGAIISLCLAILYYSYHSKDQIKQHFNWKIFIGIILLLITTAYFINSINGNKTDSNSGRYFTIKQISKQIIQKPYGYGVNSFSTEYNKAKAEYFENNFKWEEVKNGGYIYSVNNDLLELTFELGIVWIIIFVAFIFLLFKRKNSNIEVLLARTILLCLLIFSLTNNIFMIPILIIIAVICSVIIINNIDEKIIYEFKNNTVYKFAAAGIILFFLLIQTSRINAEYKLYKLYQGKNYLKGINQLKGYLSKIDTKGEECFMGGIVLMKNGYKKEGMDYMKTGFELSGKPTLGRILANSLKKQKKFAQAETIYNYNKNVEPYRYEARMDLLDLFVETNQQEKAKKMALEIINLPVKIPSKAIAAYKKKAQLYSK